MTVTYLGIFHFFSENQMQFEKKQMTVAPFSDQRLWIPDLFSQ